MAGVRFVASSGEIDTGTAAKTILQLSAAGNHRALVDELSVQFGGVSNTDEPVLVRLVRQTSAGTGGTAGTVHKANPGDAETVQTQATVGPASAAWTGEPTDAGQLALPEWKIHPQSGLVWQAPLDQPVVVPGSGRIGVVVTSAVDVPVVVGMRGSE